MVHEFYASYIDTIVHPMRRDPSLVRFMEQPQLDHTLVRRFRVDISVETFLNFIFGLDYITQSVTID